MARQDYPVSITLRATKDGSFSATFQGGAEEMERLRAEADAAARSATGAVAPIDAMGRSARDAGAGARDAAAGIREATIGGTGLRPGMQGAADAARVFDTSARGAAGAARDAAAATSAAGAAAAAAAGDLNGAAAAAAAAGTASAGAAAAAAAAGRGWHGGAAGAGAMAGQTKLAGWQVQQLSMQLNDMATMALMGASPFQILASQGGQVYQVFGSVGTMLRFIASLITPVTVGIAALAVAAGGLTIAAMGNASSIAELDRAYARAGETTGFTRDAFERLTQTTADTANVSERAARQIGAALLDAGGLAGGTIAELSGFADRYAKILGVDLVDATRELGAAFKDPIKAARDLDGAFGFLSAAQQRDIRNLVQQGEKTKAQALLASQLDQRLKELARGGLTETTGWWDKAAAAANRYAAAALAALDTSDRRPRSVQLGEQLETAESELARLQSQSPAAEALTFGLFGNDRRQRELQATIRRLREQMAADDEQRRLDVRLAEQGRQGEARRQLGLQAQPVIDAADPVGARRGEITREIQLLNRAMAAGAISSTDGAKAIALLRKEYADLKDPLEKVGNAYGDALKDLRANADAQERLAAASAGGTAAIREAELANEAHAFAARAAAERWASYQSAYDAAMASLARGDLAAATAAFNAWTTEQDKAIGAATAMAEATAKGNAAVAEANVQARIAAEVQGLGIEGDEKRIAIVEEKIRQEERLRQVAGYNTELENAQAGLQVAQAELALAGQLPEVRDRIITRLREELRLKAQFPELADAEREALLKVLETTAETEAKTKEIVEGRDLMLEPLKNAARGVQDAFAGAFRSIFSGGVDSFEDLGDRILDIMIETAAQIAALMIFEPKVQGGFGLGSFFGLGGGPSAGGTASAGGVGLTDVGKLFSLGGGGSLSPGLDAWAQGALGFGAIGPAAGGGAAAAAGVAPVAGGLTNVGVTAAAPGLLNGGAAFGGFASLSNVLGIAGAVLPGLISGNYAQAAAGGIGAAIGTVLLPGIGTALGGIFGNLVGGLFGKGSKDKLKILSADNREGNAALGDTFDDDLALRSPYGYVGLSDNKTSGFDAGFVSNLVKALQRADRATAQYLSGDEIDTVATALQSQGGYSRSDRKFGEEEFGKTIRGRLRPILKAVGINEQLIAATLSGTDADELMQAAQELLARRAAVRDIIAYSGEEGEIRKAQRQSVESLRGVIDELGAANDDFGFSAEGAAAASKRLVMEFLGIADVAEPMSDVEKAIAGLNERFEQAAGLAAQVGLTTPIEELKAQALAKLGEGYLEGTERAIRAIVDPLGLALEDFDKVADERLEEARRLGLETVLIERRNGLERNRIIEQFTGQALSGLQSLYDDLLGGSNSPLAPETVLANAEGRYRALRDAAFDGDTDARDEVGGAIQDMLAAAKEMFASGPEFFRYFDEAQATLQQLLGISKPAAAAMLPAPSAAPAPAAPVPTFAAPPPIAVPTGTPQPAASDPADAMRALLERIHQTIARGDAAELDALERLIKRLAELERSVGEQQGEIASLVAKIRTAA